MLPPQNTVYDILNDQNNCEQQVLDFYKAYIKAVSCVSIYTDVGDYKKYYIEELENEIKNRIIESHAGILATVERGLAEILELKVREDFQDTMLMKLNPS